jgi:peptidoglycan/LPS O-acetylase OafA/YrhL
MFLQISSRWLVVASHLIAKYSYGIYLTHFFSIWFAFERLGYLPTIEKISLFAVLVTGLPVIFYHALEEPMTRLGKRVADSYARGPHPRKAVALQTSS